MNRIYIILAGILLLGGCERALDTKVTWQIGDEDIWRVPELAMGVLHKAYNGINNRPDCYADNFLDAATDNAVCTQHSASVYKLGQGAMTSFNNPIGNWATCYNMLEYVNSFLENGLTDNVLYNRADPAVDASIKDRLRGEAYFLRAWWHFELLRMYGGKGADGKALGVPLADHFFSYEEASDNGEFFRPTYQATVDFICSDLDKAMELLPASYSGSDQNFGDTQIGRATSTAAAVLKSRVLVYSASPAMQDDDIVRITGMGTWEIVNPDLYRKKWELVAKQIASILVMDGFGTYDPLLPEDIADVQSESTDFAFRKYFSSNLLEANHFPPYYFGDAMTVPSHNLVKAFCAKNGFPVTDPRSGVDITEPGLDMARLYSVMDATVSGLLNPVQSSNAAHYNPLLRKSEVLLNYAEASNEAYGPSTVGEGSSVSAYDIMKSVRNLSGGIMSDAWLDECAASTEDFRALIQNERRIELAFENHRYFDMRRWLMPLNEDITGVEITRNEDNTFSFTEKVVEQRKYSVENYYAPIPYAEISKNPNLVNNVGW